MFFRCFFNDDDDLDKLKVFKNRKIRFRRKKKSAAHTLEPSGSKIFGPGPWPGPVSGPGSEPGPWPGPGSGPGGV